MMLGLLYKDIVSSKKWILFIWGLAVALPIGMVFDPLGMKIALPFLLVMSYTAVLLRFFQAEEKNNTMVLLKTLPIPYFMIVAAKYLLCFLTVFSSLPLFFLMSLIMPGVGISAWSGVSAFFILYLFLFGTSYSAIVIFVSLRWGSSYSNAAVIAVYFLSFALMKYVIPNFSMTQTLLNILIPIALFLISIVLFTLSVKAVKTRNFLKD